MLPLSPAAIKPAGASLVTDEVLQVAEPVHVQALVLVERHAFDESAKVLVDAEAFKVLGQGSLDPFVERGEIGTSILLDLALKTMELLDLVDVVGHLHAVVVDLSVDGGALNDETLAVTAVSDEDGEVAVVLSLGAALFVALILLVRELLVVGNGLPANTHKSAAWCGDKRF